MTFISSPQSPHQQMHSPSVFMLTVLIGIAAVGLCYSAKTYALSTDAQQPIELEADKAIYQAKAGLITYLGNIHIKQGTFELYAQTLKTQLAKDQSILSLVATGTPARFSQKLDGQSKASVGRGESIEYQAQTGIVTLRKNAYLSHNGTIFTGEQIRYNMQQGDIEASGSPKTRIKLIMPPRSNSKPNK